MSRLKWNQVGERYYETGVDQGVLYPMVENAYPKGVAWDSLISVTQSPSGAESTSVYASNIKYLNLVSAEDFNATVEAYYSPKEFDACDGSQEVAKGVSVGQQTRVPFGMCYRTRVGNDTKGTEAGYKLHLIYGAQASPSEKAYQTINESPEAMTLSWEITTTPVDIPGFKPSATMTIDSRTTDPEALKELEDVLYGTNGDSGEGTEPRLPLPEEVIEIVGALA